MAYRKYDPMVKKLIIETGNKNLFPDLNIPRTTINYWLKQSKEPTIKETNDVLEQAVKSFKKENYKLNTQLTDQVYFMVVMLQTFLEILKLS
jgi:hypothetical protein